MTNASTTSGAAPSENPNALWTRDFVLLLVSSLLLWCSFHLLLAALPLHIVHNLGGDSAQVGLLSTLVSMAAMVARPFAGYALDHQGRRLVHLGTLLWFFAMSLPYALPGGLMLLFVARALSGIPFGAATTATQTVASDLVPARRRGEGIGYASMASTLAMGVAPTIALHLLQAGEFSRVVVSAAVMAAAAAVLALGMRHPVVHNATARLSLSALLEPRVGRLSLTIGAVLVGFGAVLSFATLYAEELGLSNPGLFFTVYAVGALVARPVSGPLFDRRGPRLLALGSLGLLLVAYLLLGFCSGEMPFLSAGFLLGLGLASLVLAMQTMAVNVVPAARRGAANATLLAAIDLGFGVGSFALGALASAAGSYAAMYRVAAALLLLPAGMFFLWVLPSYERQMVA